MKQGFGKKIAVLVLVLALTVVVMSAGAMAATCKDGYHTPGNEPHTADWNSTDGGYGYDYYLCTVCGAACDKLGYNHVFVDASNGCSGASAVGGKGHIVNLNNPITLSCNDTSTAVYQCTHCKRYVNAKGEIIDLSTFKNHKAGTDINSQNYYVCTGGYKTNYYICTVCGVACDQSGNGIAYEQRSQKHTPGNEKHNANWNSQTDGYGDDYYLCTVCNRACNADGLDVAFVDASNGCSGGTKCHVVNTTDEHQADWDACTGGYKVNYYICTNPNCQRVVDANGTVIEWSAPVHTPDTNKLIVDPDCIDGVRTTHYHCTLCGADCNADGSITGLTWAKATAKHTPDPDNKNEANYSACNGGYKDDFYICTKCERPCDENGDDAVYTAPDPNTAHSPVAKDPDYHSCTGGFKSAYYECENCGNVFKDNTCTEYAEWSKPDDDPTHTPDTDKPQQDDLPDCATGIRGTYYNCKYCGMTCDENGKTLEPTQGSVSHSIGAIQKANYTDCGGGYKDDYYECSVCGQAFKDSGCTEYADWSEPVSSAKHTHGSESHIDPNCVDGIHTTYYICTKCEQPCDANGDSVNGSSATEKHAPGNEKHIDPDCVDGGIHTTYYTCTKCDQPCDANGDSVNGSPATEQHKLGTTQTANYTSCGGGYKEDYYECSVCGQAFKDSNGTEYADWSEPDSKHTPDTSNPLVDPNCVDGIHSTYYICKVCEQACDASGNTLEGETATSNHDLKKVEATPATADKDGNKEYWQCKNCDNKFFDADGRNPVQDENDIILGKVVTVNALTSVPETVASTYTSVEAVNNALQQAAIKADATLVKEQAGIVTMDVELKIEKADGTKETVKPEDFPAGGVDAVLPYPDGTDSSYTFVINHMITHGDNVGTIETMAYTLASDGIHVHFSSLSPVSIAYKAPAKSSGTTTTTVSTTTATTTANAPKTGDSSSIALWSVMLVLSALAAALVLPKRKRQ